MHGTLLIVSANGEDHGAAAIDQPLENALSAAPRSCHCYVAASTRRSRDIATAEFDWLRKRDALEHEFATVVCIAE